MAGATPLGAPTAAPRRRSLSFAARIVLLANGILVIAVVAVAVLGFTSAREALQSEMVAAGEQKVADFARTNTLEFLDPEKGASELDLRLRALAAVGSGDPLLGGWVFDRSGKVLASAGPLKAQVPALDFAHLEEGAAVVRGPPQTVSVAAPVIYDRVRLGSVVFAFDGSRVDQAGSRFIQRSSAIAAGLLFLNVLALWALVQLLMRPVRELASAADALAGGDYQRRVPDTGGTDEVARAASSFNRMADALSVHMRFSNGALIERIRRGEATDSIDEQPLTIAFGDAEGYTTWSASQSPRAIFETLGRYYTCIGRIAVHAFGGIIDKFIGDGVLLHFGFLAPRRDAVGVSPEVAQAGLRAIISAQVALRVLAWSIETFEARPALRYRFGIASGKCMVGPVGAQDVLLDYSLIGGVVNLASRLEGLASPGGLVIDRFTMLDSKDFVAVEDGGEQVIKGMAQRVPIFHVRGFASAEELARMRRYLADELFTDEFITGVVLAGSADPERIAKVRARLQEELARAELPVKPRATPS